MRGASRISTVVVAAAVLSGCAFLGFEDDDRRDAPPPGLFPESDFGDGAFADPEPEPGFASSGASDPFFVGDGGAGGGFASYDDRDVGAPPPLDETLLNQPARTTPTYTPPQTQAYAPTGGRTYAPAGAPTYAPAGAPTYAPAGAAADPRAHAAYLGFVPARADAEAYFDWLWAQHAARLDGAQPYVSAAPDPNTGAPAVHIYAVNVTAAQAGALCDALARTQTPCTPIAR